MAFVIDPKPQQEKVTQKVCYNCACLFGYVFKDIVKYKHSYDYLGDYETSNGVKCPQCEAINTINNRR